MSPPLKATLERVCNIAGNQKLLERIMSGVL